MTRSTPPLHDVERGPGGEAMCGIFGAVSLRHAPLKYPDCVDAMAATLAHRGPDGEQIVGHERARLGARDRKSTRLNSSHGYISYAVFCLIKKTITSTVTRTMARSRKLECSQALRSAATATRKVQWAWIGAIIFTTVACRSSSLTLPSNRA